MWDFLFLGAKTQRCQHIFSCGTLTKVSLYDGRSLRDSTIGVTGCSRIVGERESGYLTRSSFRVVQYFSMRHIRNDKNEIPTCNAPKYGAAANHHQHQQQQPCAKGRRSYCRLNPGTSATISFTALQLRCGGGQNPKKKLWRMNSLSAGNTRHFTTGPTRPRVTLRRDQSPAAQRILPSPKKNTHRGDSRGLPGSRTPRPRHPAPREVPEKHVPPISPVGPTRLEPSSSLAPPVPQNKRQKREHTHRGPPDAPGPKKLGTALEEPIDGRDPGGS